MNRTRTLLAALVTAAAVALSACGNDEPTRTGPEPAGENGANGADVTFATQMIQHHAQALVMVDLAQGRDLDPGFVTLTESIREAQAPEIETMTGWLMAWGEEVPETSRDHANSHGGHGGDTGADGSAGDTMPEMMTAEDLESLKTAPDAKFEDLWLELMVEHHEGAVEMARTEVAQRAHPEAVGLAEEVIEAQEAEIEQMRDMLGR